MISKPVQHDEASQCHNCGAAVTYHYCAVCGQETKLHVPSASEFIHEFVGHYVALEGRLWKTLAFLLFKPGFLTAEYIAGRRVRYVEPLRVYLSLSILFFALLKLVGPDVANFDEAATAKPGSTVLLKNDEPAAERLELRFAPALAARVNHFMDKPEPERNRLLSSSFFAYVPYAMFCLMPLFALFLKLLYLGSGKRYGEHLLFALHVNAFAFASFGMLILTSVLHLGLLTFVLAVWLLFYLPKAMRRVYGGSRLLTFVRWQVLSVLHLLSIFAGILVASGLAVIH